MTDAEREREAQRLLDVIGSAGAKGAGTTKLGGLAVAMACGVLVTALLGLTGVLVWLTWRWFFGG